eukprot:TRINITY_DN7966_c0_g1_i2.p1 TRINITY_DN7966_c0_g1~~TRINITY_DN7966_c0_g1_i2.p1  ORF type:complete len:598 (+),score=144.93 TRINITY_DN7966_c0_g1_i2:94-1887(+)
MANPEHVHQGMMLKRAQGKSKLGRMSWKERFFILTKSELGYYDGSTFAGQGKQKGKIDVAKMVSVEEVDLSEFKRPYMFAINHADGKLYCQAQSLADRKNWIEQLQSVMPKGGAVSAGSVPAPARNANDALPVPTPSTTSARDQPLPPIPAAEAQPEPARKTFEVIAQFPYKQMEPTDLAMEKGERLTVLNADEDHWWQAQNSRGQTGFIPANYVRKVGMESESWYMGSLSKSEASALLNVSGQDGCFLVRESESQPGQYSLSVFYKGKLKHYRIKLEGGQYRVSERHCFNSIVELIDYHKLNSGGLATRLRKPVNDLDQPVSVTLGHDKWELDHRELQLGAELGNGNFGVVRRGVYKGETDVAVKMMKPGSMPEDDFIAEAQVMMKFRHKNLVDLLGVCTTVQPIYIVTELMPNGSLLDYLKKNKADLTRDPNVLHYMSVQIASGMKFLEEHGFIHRDLAARNCLVGNNNIVKVADFGLARFTMDDEYTASEGTKFPIKWASPEVCSFARFSTKSDVWSYGVLLWEIWSLGTTPYPNMTNAQSVEQVTRGYRMAKPELCSETTYEVMKQCWHKDVETRLSFAEVLLKLEENAESYD